MGLGHSNGSAQTVTYDSTISLSLSIYGGTSRLEFRLRNTLRSNFHSPSFEPWKPPKFEVGFVDEVWTGGLCMRQVYEDEWIPCKENQKRVSAYLRSPIGCVGENHLGLFKCRTLKQAREWADGLPVRQEVENLFRRRYSKGLEVHKVGEGYWFFDFLADRLGYFDYPVGRYHIEHENGTRTEVERSYHGFSTKHIPTTWDRINRLADTL